MSNSLTVAPDDLVSRIKMYIDHTPASSRTMKNFKGYKDWIVDHKPLTTEETLFLYHTGDFVHLSGGNEDGWLDDALQDGLQKVLPDVVMRVRLRLAMPPDSALTLCLTNNREYSAHM